MKRFKNILFYIVVVGFFLFIMYSIVEKASLREVTHAVKSALVDDDDTGLQQIKNTLHHNFTHPLAILLLQIITIIITARIFSFLFRKIGQPTVIGEIIAGIFLGPSFVGYYFPEFSLFLFPKESIPNLQFLSQVGLILFMFIVGMELDLKVLRKKASEAVMISHSSIVFAFTLGVGLSYFLYDSYAPEGVSFLSFALFIGVSMSITAFPVLARIVQERQLSKTKLGAFVITCAAIDDITAWCVLAAVIAIVKAGSVISSLYIIAMAIGYVILMFKVIQPFLKRIGDVYSKQDSLSKPTVAFFFATLLLSSYITEVIGIHALFGAFMAGVIMPPNLHFRNVFVEKVEDVSLVLLLPLFFVVTGLKTQIGLLNDIHMWEICGMIITVAVIGKFWGSALTSKFMGQSWKESLTMGAFMNTRGLMELVVLNIGFDLGVLSPEIFAMMVIMALVTTFMTGPALDLINYLFKEKTQDQIEEDGPRKYKILFSFGDPERGKSMVHLANSLVHKYQSESTVSAMHLRLSNELHQYNMLELERENFRPIKREAAKLNLPIQTLFKPTLDIDKEIVETANEGSYDLLIIGMGPSIFEGSFLGKMIGITSKIINPEKFYNTITRREGTVEGTTFNSRINNIIKTTKGSLGIFIDKGLLKVEVVFIPIFSLADAFILDYAHRVIHNNGARVKIIDAVGVIQNNIAFQNMINSIEQQYPMHLSFLSESQITQDFLSQTDIMILSMDSWKRLMDGHSEWLVNSPSVLVVKP
ncbi:MAG: cation:proton antiporter [Bacteroidetes bacterium]|nr:cation:proton antiporter [Bacteroidota bacterium]